MTMQFKCDCCGKASYIPQFGAGDNPPGGYRTIYTVIEEHDEDGGISTTCGEVLHSCGDCNVHMTVDEHHEAEFESRKEKMRHD